MKNMCGCPYAIFQGAVCYSRICFSLVASVSLDVQSKNSYVP